MSLNSRPMSRTGCVLWFVLWLCLMTVPLFAFVLAVRGEVAWRRGDFVEDRVWLVNAQTAPGEDEAQGLAYSAARIASDQRPADGPVCVRTFVRFVLWKGKSESLEYCDCYLPSPGGYAPAGSCE